MTIFGPDISSYQRGLDLARLSAASFVIAKASEGTYYTDSAYAGWRQQAATLGKPFIWYHFLSGEDATAQARHTVACVGDPKLPGMLDIESEGSFSPTFAQVLAYIDAARAAGLNLCLAYLPRWYWQQLGSPDLMPLAARGVRLISSAYPGGAGAPAALYPGDSAAGWQPYGGMPPLIYQFTNRASDAGLPLDYNAFRGSTAELATILRGDTVSYIMTAGWQNDYPDVAEALRVHIPVGTVLDVDHAAAFATIRAFVAAERTAAIEAAAAVANAKLDQLLARPAAPVVTLPPIDLAALAAELGPLLQTGPSADEVAAAVQAHLAASLAKG